MSKRAVQPVNPPDNAELLDAHERRENFRKWVAFYRENPHRFAKDYLGINLKPFQQVILYQMFHKCNSMFLAARGAGKTYLIAVFCCIYAILYPGSWICVASYTRRQANETLAKVRDILMPNSPFLASEINDVKIAQAEAAITFKNGSWIKVITAGETARGGRGHVFVFDEFRLIDKKVIDDILVPFLSKSRDARFLNKPEYKNYEMEDLHYIYASSCWYESHWSYKLVKSYVENMIKGNSYFIASIPYQVAVKEGIIKRQVIENRMMESTFDIVSFTMEYMGLYWTQPSGGWFDLESIENNRVLKYPMCPSTLGCSHLNKNFKIQPKKPGEIRILSADIALMASGKVDNDATSIFINQIQVSPSGQYISHIIYTENNEGLRTDAQALTIRRLYEEFDCDYLVIDAINVGLSICDALMKDIYDPDKDVTYGAISCCNNEEIERRCAVKNAPKTLWAIKGNPDINTQCALDLREALRQGTVKLLINEYSADELISGMPNYENFTPQEIVALKLPYIHTSLLMNELVNLKFDASNGKIRIKEKSGMRKDRYSSLSYNIYVTKILEREALDRASNSFQNSFVGIRPAKISRNHQRRR